MELRTDSALSALNDPATTGTYLGVPLQTLAQWRHLKAGIRYVKVGRLIRYRREDILQFVAENMQEVG